MKSKKGVPTKKSQSRYLIGDFLEMKTRLSACEREMLLDKIDAESIESETLKSQPAFWMEKRVLLVLNQQPDECWFYYTHSGKMEKVQIRGPISAFGQSTAVYA